MRIASPFSSTSVHRSTGSSAAFARLPVVVKMESSSSSLLRLRKSGFTALGPQSLCDSVCRRFHSVSEVSSVEANLREATTLLADRKAAQAEGVRTRLTWLGRMLSTSKVGAAALRAISARRGLQVDRRREGAWKACPPLRSTVPVKRFSWPAPLATFGWQWSKKGMPSDWNRRNRSSLRDGTAGCNAGRMAATTPRIRLLSERDRI